jgi:hypothetical protein
MESAIEAYLRCWSHVFLLARRSVAWVPFFLVAVFKIVVLVLMYYFWHPLVSGFMVPALRTFGGEKVLHFPAHVRALPEMFQVAEIVITILFGFALAVWAVSVMVDTLEGNRRTFISHAGRIAVLTPVIVVVAIVFAGGTMALPLAIDRVAEEFYRRPKLEFLLSTGALGAGFLALVYLVYSPYFLHSTKRLGLGGIGASVRFARDHFALTCMIVLTAFFPVKMLQHLASDTGAFVSNSRPEWVPALWFLKVIVEIFASFFLFAAATSSAVGRRSP